MFGACKRIDWADYKLAVPAYCVLFYIPFTYSILRGVIVGYIIYMGVGLYTGDLLENVLLFQKDFWTIIFPPKAKKSLSRLGEEPSHDSLSSLDELHDQVNSASFIISAHSNIPLLLDKPSTTLGRIRKMLDDSMELQADGITKIDQF